MKSKYNFILLLDPGHGGMVDGKYVTPGKRSPLFEDGKTILYEGVNNRAIANAVHALCEKEGIQVIQVADPNLDTSLDNRVKYANETFHDTKIPCLYLSIHSDAQGYGDQWEPASGVSVYTSKGQTKSDIFASILIDEASDEIKEIKWRKDSSDGDPDKEENFYVLKYTDMPAVLCELGFHTNKIEAKRMITPEWHNEWANVIVSAVKKWIAYNKY